MTVLFWLSNLFMFLFMPINACLIIAICRQRDQAFKRTEMAMKLTEEALELMREVNAKNEATIRHLMAMIEDQVMAAPMNGNASCP